LLVGLASLCIGALYKPGVRAQSLTQAMARRKPRGMETARILCTDLAGLRAQAIGLAEAAGLTPDVRTLPPSTAFSRLWRSRPADAVAEPLPKLIIGCGGAGARLAASLRRPGVAVVAIQHPRMALNNFDLVLAARHDGITGPNVIVTRNALHRVTPARLAMEAERWRPVFAGLPRPLVAVLLGGSNGRYRFGAAEARALAAQLAAIMDQDGASLTITPSRRTAPEVLAILREVLLPRGAWIWDGTGENPYFGMLALADAIIVTADSVSMVSEAVATPAPVMLARLPGKSARIGAFMDAMVQDGRVKNFAGRLEIWDTAPLDDTPLAAAALNRLLRGD
jgi:mitochondrial fission protein ELM1